MNVFIIPSWYPSLKHPTTGIFIKNQALALAEKFPDWQIGIGHWGPHEESLWIDQKSGLKNLEKIIKGKPEPVLKSLTHNCKEYFHPAWTWTRLWKNGNMENIIKSCEEALRNHITIFEKPDIIHAHVAYPGGYVAFRLSQKYGIPYIITEHMTPFPFSSLSKGNGLPIDPIQKSLENAGAVITVSDSLAKKIKAKTRVACTTIPNLVSEDIFCYKKCERKTTAVFIGRLTEQKGISVLSEALELVRLQRNEFSLKVIGDGDQNSLIHSLQARYPQCIDWLPFVKNEALPSHINQSGFLILPSLHENNPLVILEALACGKPVVATACGGPEEIINEQNGLLAKPGDPKDLAEKIIHVVNTIDRYDPAIIRKDFEARFSAKVVTQQLKTLYQKVIADHSASL